MFLPFAHSNHLGREQPRNQLFWAATRSMRFRNRSNIQLLLGKYESLTLVHCRKRLYEKRSSQVTRFWRVCRHGSSIRHILQCCLWRRSLLRYDLRNDLDRGRRTWDSWDQNRCLWLWRNANDDYKTVSWSWKSCGLRPHRHFSWLGS